MAIDTYWFPNSTVGQYIVRLEPVASDNDDFDVILNGVTVTFHSATSGATQLQIRDGLLAALQASTDPAITAQTYEGEDIGGAKILRINGPETGEAFTYSTSIAPDGAFTVTSAAGGTNPHNWIDNWASPSSTPVDGQNILIDNDDNDILYFLNQASVQLASATVGPNFIGTLGMPQRNDTGIQYWHPAYLRIDPSVWNINAPGSGRLKIDSGSYQTTANVYATGQSVDAGLEPVLWKGTHASNVVNVIGGEVGIAVLETEIATIATLRVGPDGVVRCGADVTLDTLQQDGGTVRLNGSVTTVNKIAGDLTVTGTGTATTLRNDGGTVAWNSSGTITTLKVSNGGIIDFGQDVRPVTVTNCTLEAGSTLLDPFRRVTFTNGIIFDRCSLKDVANLDVGTHVTLTITPGP